MIRRDILIQSLGNLTLLTEPLNSSVSRGPFVEKRPAMALQSKLALNTHFQTQMTWTHASIVDRASTLAAKALAVWLGPSTDA